MSKSVRANGASLRCEGRIRSSHQVTTSGNDRSRSVSPVGAQSTITQSNSPSSWWRLIQSSENSSSMPGRHGQLLGRDAVDAALGEQVAEPALHAVPVALHLLLGLHLLAEEVRADVGRLGAERRLERVGQAVGGVGGEHDGAQARGGAAARCGGRHARLADSALARVEDGAGRHQPPHSSPTRRGRFSTSISRAVSVPSPRPGAQLLCRDAAR